MLTVSNDRRYGRAEKDAVDQGKQILEEIFFQVEFPDASLNSF